MTTPENTTGAASADPSATQQFAERLFGDLLGVMSVAGVYLGDRLGLYAAMRDGQPITSPGLAEQCGITERYAREWLEHQAAHGILELASPSPDAQARQFALPAAHATVLADRDNLDFLGWIGRGTVAAVGQLPEVAEAFRTGAGVPWEAFGDEMRTMQGDANRPMFLQLLGIEYLPAILDVHERLLQGGRVAEVGSGLGWASIGMALAYPNIIVDGYDIDARSVELATAHAEESGVTGRVVFHTVDASHADAPETYDLVTAFECIHDMPDPVNVLRRMREMTAPGGAVIVMDERADEEFQAPANEIDPFLYGFSLMVCLPDGLSHQPSIGTGTVMRPPTFRRYAQEAGFQEVAILEELEHPFFRFYRLHP